MGARLCVCVLISHGIIASPPGPGVVPFALSQDLGGAGFSQLLPHRLWVPCIMSPHQNQVCLPGPPAQPQGLPTHSEY